MDKNSISILFNNFSQNDIKNFRLFLLSPYNNKSRQLILFFDIISSGKRSKNKKLTREEISAKMYPAKKYNDSTIRNLYSDLSKAAIEFLAAENFRRSKRTQFLFLQNELSSRNLSGEFERATSKFERDVYDDVDFNYFYVKHRAESNKFNYSYNNTNILRNKNTESELLTLNKSTAYLAYYFITELISQFIASRTYSLNYNTPGKDGLPEKILNLLSPQKLSSFLPSNDKYRYIIQLYTALINIYEDFDNEKKYFRYKKLFSKFSGKLSRDERSMHSNNMVSYCIHRISEGGNEEFVEELFNLYKLIIENEYYINSSSGHLPHELFRNILLEAIRMKKFDWSKNFIDKYHTKVQPAEIQNMKLLGYAYLNFALEKYNEALDNITGIHTDFFLFKLNEKNLRLQIFYKLGYYEEALYLMKTYSEFLRTNKFLNPERKKRYNSFIKLTGKLIQYKLGNIKHDPDYIKHQICKNPAVAFKPWLIAQASKLLKTTQKTTSKLNLQGTNTTNI